MTSTDPHGKRGGAAVANDRKASRRRRSPSSFTTSMPSTMWPKPLWSSRRSMPLSRVGSESGRTSSVTSRSLLPGALLVLLGHLRLGLKLRDPGAETVLLRHQLGETRLLPRLHVAELDELVGDLLAELGGTAKVRDAGHAVREERLPRGARRVAPVERPRGEARRAVDVVLLVRDGLAVLPD